MTNRQRLIRKMEAEKRAQQARDNPIVVEYNPKWDEPKNDLVGVPTTEDPWEWLAYGYGVPLSAIYAFMDSYLISLDPHKACIDAGIASIVAPRLAAEHCVQKALADRMKTLARMTEAPSDAIQGMALSKASTIQHLKEILADKGDLSAKVQALKDALNDL